MAEKQTFRFPIKFLFEETNQIPHVMQHLTDAVEQGVVIQRDCPDDMSSEFITSCPGAIAMLKVLERRCSVRYDEKIEDDPEKWKKFWSSLTGDRKHKFTACVKKLSGKPGIKDVKAFCGKLKAKYGKE